MPNRLSLFGFGLVWVFFFFLYLILPTQTALGLLHHHAESLTAYRSFFLLVSLAASFLFIALYKLQLSLEGSHLNLSLLENFSEPEPTLFLKRAYLLLGIVLWTGTFLSMNRPMDTDEYFHAVNLSNGQFLTEMSPLKHFNHILAQLFSGLSLKCFGKGVFQYRLPNLLFLAVMLFSLQFIFKRYLLVSSSFLLLGHLISNAYTGWYFSSARGYLLMMVLNFLSLVFFFSILKNRKVIDQKTQVFIGGLFLLGSFTHLFAGIFNGILFLSVFIYLVLNRNALSIEFKKSAIKCLYLLTGFLLLGAILALAQGKSLAMEGDLGGGGSPEGVWYELSALFGFQYPWQLRVLLLGYFWIFFQAIRLNYKIHEDFFAIFFLVSSSVLFILFWGLKVQTFHFRYFVSFLLPWLIFWCESILRFTRPSRRIWAIIILGFILIFLPLQYRSHAKAALLQGGWQEFDDFMRKTLILTAPEESRCIRVVSQANDKREKKNKAAIFARYAEGFYFPSNPKGCLRHYRLEFRNSLPQSTETFPAAGSLLLRNDLGMFLFQE